MKISKEEINKIMEAGKEKLNEIDEMLENAEIKEIIDGLKDKYSVCEMVYMAMLKEAERVNYIKGKNDKINFSTVKKLMNGINLNCDMNELHEIFAVNSNIKGNHTIRTIRNDITHNLKSKSIK